MVHQGSVLLYEYSTYLLPDLVYILLFPYVGHCLCLQ